MGRIKLNNTCISDLFLYVNFSLKMDEALYHDQRALLEKLLTAFGTADEAAGNQVWCTIKRYDLYLKSKLLNVALTTTLAVIMHS